jgi:hypothetical protein
LERLLDGQWEVEAARECWGVVPSKQLQQCSPATPACTHLPGPAPAPACAACAAPAVSESLSPAPWPSHRRPLRSSQAAGRGRGSLREGGSGREQWQGAVAGSSGRGQWQTAAVVFPRLPLAHAAPTPNNSQPAHAPRPTHLMPPLHLRYQRHLSLQQQRDAQQAQCDAAHIPHKLPIVADPAQGAAVALRQQPRLDQPAARGRRGVWGADRPLACSPQRACSAQMPTP